MVLRSSIINTLATRTSFHCHSNVIAVAIKYSIKTAVVSSWGKSCSRETDGEIPRERDISLTTWQEGIEYFCARQDLIAAVSRTVACRGKKVHNKQHAPLKVQRKEHLNPLIKRLARIKSLHKTHAGVIHHAYN